MWPDPTQEEAARFLKNYYHSHHMAGLVKHTAFDFLYLPHFLAAEYVTFARYFLKNTVIVELALPTILYGIAKGSDMVQVKGSVLWFQNHRAAPHSFFNRSHFYIHPFKLKASLDKHELRQFFCDVYLEMLMSELEKRSKR